MRYNRRDAISYAQKWALKRNPKYYNYDLLGGDCTNFISQCLYSGLPQMNYQGYGWYYADANHKSASWTGVEFLYNFLINNVSVGPRGSIISKTELELGDLIQLSFMQDIYSHTLIVTKIKNKDIFVCAHSHDALNRPLDSYSYENVRYIKIN